MRVRTGVALLVVLAAAVLAAAPAGAATNGAAAVAGSQPRTLPPPIQISPTIYPWRSLTAIPPTFAINARRAIAISDRTEQVRKARARHPGLQPKAYISPLELAAGRFYHWDIVYSTGDTAWVEVELGRTGHVFEIQTYPDVGWPLLRGYSGVLGEKLNAPYVWLPLCLLFLLPFFDPRRPFRLLQFDLLAILGFGISQFFFTKGRPDISVPLVYPFLLYAAIRLAWAGFRPSRRQGPLIPSLSWRFLTGLLICFIALRIGFTIFGSSTFDVSAAGVVGADRIEHGQQLYVFNDVYGDTYGPVNYIAYIPAELAFPVTTGIVDAARAATLMFDLLTLLGLFLLGRSLRPGSAGRRLGLALAYAWAACPYTALLLASTTNDALVPMFVVYALLALRSPPGRGALAGVATMAKFAPALLAPVLVVGRGPFRLRAVVVAGAAFAAVCAALVFAFLPDGGLREFWDTTLGFQLHRTSPLSIWIRAPQLSWLRPITEAAAIGLAVTAAFVPRRRTVGQVAALCGAILVAAQIPANYWIYFYVAWFAPFLFIALFEEYSDLGADQDSATRSLVNPVRISQPSSVTATRSSIRTPSLPGR
jgi:hypothetical protein